jgi:hypothetical protein
MKIRNGFVSNSSSTSFVIKNLTGDRLTLEDFVEENPQLIKEFRDCYDWNTEEDGFTQEELLKSARANNIDFDPNSEQECVFGDSQGTLIGQVFDYILRDGGTSKSFSWRFKEYYR